jgi:hypothetical protein
VAMLSMSQTHRQRHTLGIFGEGAADVSIVS